MFSLGEKLSSIPHPRRTPGGAIRRVRSRPQVVPLEDRALLSGSAAPHAAVGVRPVIAAEVRGDRAFVDSLYHNGLHRALQTAARSHWVHLLTSGMSREQVKRAFLALPQYRRLLAIEQGDPSPRSGAGSAMHG